MKRTYRRDLRDAQAARTADQILDAVHALASRGERELPYTQIAEEAGVSVPTVYRHYPSREDLLRAYAARVVPPAPPATTPAEGARTFFARFDDPADPLGQGKLGRLSAAWEFSRVGTVPGRRAWLEEHVDRAAPGLREPERTWIVDLGVVLLSSATGEAFHGYLGRSGAETADRVVFALETLFERARALAEEAP